MGGKSLTYNYFLDTGAYLFSGKPISKHQ